MELHPQVDRESRLDDLGDGECNENRVHTTTHRTFFYTYVHIYSTTCHLRPGPT